MVHVVISEGGPLAVFRVQESAIESIRISHSKQKYMLTKTDTVYGCDVTITVFGDVTKYEIHRVEVKNFIDHL